MVYQERNARKSKQTITVPGSKVSHRTMEDFESKRVRDPDIVELRFKHFQQRLIDTLNRVIVERKRLSKHNKFLKYTWNDFVPITEIERLRGHIRKSAPVGGQAKAQTRMQHYSVNASRNNLVLTPAKPNSESPIFLTASVQSPIPRIAASKKDLAPPLIGKRSSLGQSIDEIVAAEEQRAQREKERIKQEMLKKIKLQEERNLQSDLLKERMDLHEELMKKKEKQHKVLFIVANSRRLGLVKWST